ncbi:MATE family efflux transporter [Myxococcus llanfairpwllgwyngyllgogerychwyrndrobwllllantysiliogogogochensis]|uniref:MATE family efflux transporter n=1 Tax=Myxococcus llanfairpwllgwyngyllgogerychwyrndrobwllllantysiliogogogochensis TaxID=2590453 RepID=A0A540X8Q1_9BACT|nr:MULTISPECIES: MATE family efflux transporter [Myxococcus]NTX50712.1 MATE family efflux transporter [Myxococcus sp. CA039A]TQF17559.1 MATE family efflux transporter [Myxococcus llanfairpwllgwyngyllgogerychwyrndrobwllllantysiliogogogochensis]
MQLKSAVPLSTEASSERGTSPGGASGIREALLNAPILPTLLKLAVPTTVVLVAQAFVGVVETWYVSFLGTDALAGVSLVFPIFMLMTMMSNGGIGSGVASAVARATGANRKEDADALVWHAVVMGLGLGLASTVLAWLFGPALYRALGGAEGALEAAVRYSNYLFAGAIPFWVVNLLAAALRGAGNVKLPATVTLAGAGILVVISPVLIFGAGPLPALGIAGAGLAMVLFYLGASLWLLRHLASGRTSLRLAPVRLEARLIRDILRVGLPTALSAVQPNLTVIIVTGAVGLFGVEALAGYGIAARLDYLLVPLLFGLGTAVLTMVGTNAGAGNWERARRTAWVGAWLGFGVAGSIGLLAAVAPNAWLHFFSKDAAVLAPGVTYLRIVAPFYGLLGLGFVLGFAAQGVARVFWPVLAGTARMVIAAGVGWVAVVYFDAGLPMLFSLVSAALVAFAGVTVAATLAGAIFREGPK